MNEELEQLLKEAPTLTLNPFAQPGEGIVAAEGTTVENPKEADKVLAKQAPLTPEEERMVEEFAAQIDITNTKQVLEFGAASQKKIADFSETALGSVRTKDMGEIGQMLTDVIGQLREFDEEEQEKGFFGLFKRNSHRLANLKAKYDKAEVTVNKICQMMESHQVTLLKDVAILDRMYELNLSYFKELSMYILAGKRRLEEAKTKELPAMLAKAEASGLPEDVQAAKDFAAQIERFEKKIYDLELSRAVSLQMAPQIRLIQANDTAMSEKIQSTIVNTIPLWKSQMVIAIGLDHSNDAARAQREVTDMTNKLLRQNAESLRTATIETAKESERGIVDIETLTATNQTLISTLDEVMKIQEEGRAKRKAAEEELLRIEDEMQKKLVEMTRSSTMGTEE